MRLYIIYIQVNYYTNIIQVNYYTNIKVNILYISKYI